MSMILCVYAHAHVCVRGCVCVPSGLWVACCVAVLCVALVFGGVVLVFGGGVFIVGDSYACT